MPRLTLDFTDEQATRVADWFRTYTGNPEATLADYRAWLIQITRDKMFAAERQSIQPEAFDPT